MGNLDQWAKDIGLNSEEQASLEKLLGEDRSKKAAGYGLRQDAFDRKLNEEKQRIAAREKQLEESSANLEGLMRQTAAIRDEAKQDNGRISAENKKLIERAARLEANVRKQALDAGLDPDEVIKQIGVDAGAPAEPRREVEPPDFDDRFKKIEESSRERYLRSLRIDAELGDLADEHRELFGKPLKRTEILKFAEDEFKRSGRDLTPTQAWEELYKVPDKRAEKQEEAIQTRVKAAADDAYTRGRSEAVIGKGGEGGGAKPMSPALRLPRMGEDGKPAEAPAHLQRATEALAKAAAGIK